MGQYGVGRGLSGDYPEDYDDADAPFTPAWQEQHQANPRGRRREPSGTLANVEGSRLGMLQGLAHPAAPASVASVAPEDACPDYASPSSAKESAECVVDRDENA